MPYPQKRLPQFEHLIDACLGGMDCNLCWLCLGSTPDTDLNVMAERRQEREQPLQSKVLEMTLQHSGNVGLRNPELLCNFCLRQP